jgi:hypothetical protein
MMLVRHKINESGACFVEAIRRSTVTLHQDMKELVTRMTYEASAPSLQRPHLG